MEIVGIGTDIVECLRIGRMIAEHGELFLTRVYTTREISYCQARKLSTEHFAGRCRAVVEVPFDKHLEAGATVALELMAKPTRQAWLELAAAVGDGIR